MVDKINKDSLDTERLSFNRDSLVRLSERIDRLEARQNAPIYEAQVQHNQDSFMSGRLYVLAPEKGPEPFWVHPLVPTAGGDYGFFSMPAANATVYVQKLTIDGASKWFWIGATWTPVRHRHSYRDHTLGPKGSVKYSPGVPDENWAYRGNRTADKHIWRTPYGHTIEMSEKKYSDPAEGEVAEEYMLLRTRGGKKFLMDDGVGEQFDKILIEDELGNRFRIQTGVIPGGGSDPNAQSLGANGAEIDVKGNIYLNSKAGSIEIQVDEGEGDITILNSGDNNVVVKALSGKVQVFANDNVEVTTNNNAIVKVANDATVDVSGNATVDVGKNSTIAVAENSTIDVGEKVTLTAGTGIDMTATEGNINIKTPAGVINLN